MWEDDGTSPVRPYSPTIQSLWEDALIHGNEAHKNIPDEGACGFAWIVISPNRGPFVKYLKSIGEGYSSDARYMRGYHVMMNSGKQSLVANSAMAKAVTEFLKPWLENNNITWWQRFD